MADDPPTQRGSRYVLYERDRCGCPYVAEVVKASQWSDDILKPPGVAVTDVRVVRLKEGPAAAELPSWLRVVSPTRTWTSTASGDRSACRCGRGHPIPVNRRLEGAASGRLRYRRAAGRDGEQRHMTREPEEATRRLEDARLELDRWAAEALTEADTRAKLIDTMMSTFSAGKRRRSAARTVPSTAGTATITLSLPQIGSSSRPRRRDRRPRPCARAHAESTRGRGTRSLTCLCPTAFTASLFLPRYIRRRSR